MCGIAGIYSVVPDSTGTLSKQVTRMVHRLSHRGPDDQGVWTDPAGRLTLGHCRLSIIDLTQNGHQPMVSKCGRYVITLNGEIYNFLEIRSTLESSGTQFHGNSDTEVLLEAVSRWGLRDTLDRIVGMFAFGLWDAVEQKLFLVRDRLGKKPLYYLKTPVALYFASEIKALKCLGNVQLTLNLNALNHFLTCGYIPLQETIYKEVVELPPAHYGIFNNSLNFTCRQYWSLDWNPKLRISFNEAVENAEGLLREAVKIRLKADCPLGFFLSSGIDSGLVVALARQFSNQELLTLTVKSDDKIMDESVGAETVARKYGTSHRVIQVNPDIKNDLPKILEAYDEPFSDASAIPSYLISREARKYVKVIINGDGGDELFCGYRRHRAMFLLSKYNLVFSPLNYKWIMCLYKWLPTPSKFRSYYAFLHRFLRGIKGDPFNRYIAWCMDGFDEEEKASLWLSDKNASIESTPALFANKFCFEEEVDPLDHFLHMDLFLNLPDCLLVKMDIATMAHGLEARSPFLDHRLVEYASKLSPHLKLKGLNTKPILRRIAQKYLPKSVIGAPKRGFEIPLIKWLRNDLFEMVNEICLSRRGIVMQLFKKTYIEDLISGRLELDPGRWANRVWILFTLGMWEKFNENCVSRS